MNEVLLSVRALPGYRLELAFENGSTAVVNMAKRVQTIRFSRIASPEVFSTARAEGEKPYRDCFIFQPTYWPAMVEEVNNGEYDTLRTYLEDIGRA